MNCLFGNFFSGKESSIEDRPNRKDGCDCQYLRKKVIILYNCLGCIISRVKRQWSIDSKLAVLEKHSLGLQA